MRNKIKLGLSIIPASPFENLHYSGRIQITERLADTICMIQSKLPVYCMYVLLCSLGLNFTWMCRGESLRDLDNSGEAGCHYRAGDKESVGNELRVNNSLMEENTSYFITVQVTKDERQAEFTQEVFIVPGDPPEVQIRYVKLKKLGS